MNWAEKQHPIETIVEWLAPVPLALAVGWAGTRVGSSIVELAAVGFAVFCAGFAAIRIVGEKGAAKEYDFYPPMFEEATFGEMGELLLEAKDELLELDDPLIEIAPDSRVVQLFARQEPTPGELVDRIADFLGEGRRPVSSLIANPTQFNAPVDASTALHAALANIRASLR